MTKKNISIAILAVIIIAGMLLMKSNNVFDEKPTVVVTIAPLYDIADTLFGDQVNVIQLLPNGASPHAYSLTPKQAQQVAKADIVFAIGHGIDDWVTQIATEEQLQIVSEGVDLRTSTHDHDEGLDHEDEDHEEEESYDPHYWISYINAQNIINTIALRTTYVLELQNEDEILLQAQLMRDEFAKAFRDALTLVSESQKDIKIVTFHDAFGYLANDLRIDVVDTFEEFPGKEPTAADIAAIQNVVQEYGISVIFTEPQLASDNIKSLLSDVGLELRVLDPLGSEGYLEMLDYNVREIIR